MTDTKQALLDSAERAARTLGFDGFSYADLAKDVGIRKASIHYHFPTKADLSVALMSRYHFNLEAACKATDASASTGGARLIGLIEQYRAAHDGGKCLCLCVSLSASRDSLPDGVIEQISRFRVMIIDWLTHVFEMGANDGTIAHVSSPASEAAATLSLLEGAQLAARAEKNPELFESAIGLLHARLS